MTTLTLRATTVLVALAVSGASLLAPTTTATAATAVEAAASFLGLSTYTVTEVPGTGDITKALSAAASSAGSSYEAHVVHLPAGAVTVNASIRLADKVYVVAEAGTTVTWRGTDAYLLRFSSVTGGVYGGTWNGGGRATTTLIGMTGATVQVAGVTVTNGKYGIGAYAGSSLTVRDVRATGNKVDGVHVNGSQLDASGLRSTGNRRNGVQLSGGSAGSIVSSVLDGNGQAVSGSTTGKVGHGLGVAASNVTVVSTSMSRNKVCGVSLSTSGRVTISGGSHLDNNGRHGLGTTPGARASISDSTVNRNGYNGVLASGSGTHVLLQHVTIDTAKQRGLSVPSGGSATIAGSFITGGRKYSVSVSEKGRLTMLADNTISRSQSHGIIVSGRGTITITGNGNVVTSNRGDGLRLTGSGTTGRISAKVSFLKNRGSGVVVVSKARLAMVTCNFSGNRHKVEKRSGGKVTKLG